MGQRPPMARTHNDEAGNNITDINTNMAMAVPTVRAAAPPPHPNLPCTAVPRAVKGGRCHAVKGGERPGGSFASDHRMV